MKDLSANFWAFHERNPHVYAKLVEIAHFVQSKGRASWGIAAIFERLRWVSEFETEGDLYKLNNDYRAFYSRMLMREPDLSGFFRVRVSAADSDVLLKKAA